MPPGVKVHRDVIHTSGFTFYIARFEVKYTTHGTRLRSLALSACVIIIIIILMRMTKTGVLTPIDRLAPIIVRTSRGESKRRFIYVIRDWKSYFSLVILASY